MSETRLPAITYKPGWSFDWVPIEDWMVEGHDQAARLSIRVVGDDSEGGPRDVLYGFTVPLPFDPAWLLNRLAGLEDHETREWLRVDGIKPFDPHGSDREGDSDG